MRRKSSRRMRLMRLRPTACGSTLRETAKPRRAGRRSDNQCRLSSGCAARRPPSKTSVNSLRARTRALRGKAAVAASVAAALAALGAAAGQHLAAVGRRHACTEAVVALALEVAGLVGALGGHDGLVRSADGKNRAF